MGSSMGGNGYPKFLSDVMIEGQSKRLRCVGIDTAIPSSKKPEPRELLNQTYKEGRILLARDVKLLKYQYLATNQVYRVKSLLKQDQLAEVFDTFQLKISKDQLMSRRTKCNGSFIQKALTIEKLLKPQKGTQYHNAVPKFISLQHISE